jgi:hypothetical protein
MCGIVGTVSKTSVNQALFDALTVLQHRQGRMRPASRLATAIFSCASQPAWYVMSFGQTT